MTSMEECVRTPELIENIISYLGHNDQLACLQVNSTWKRLATPHVVRWSIQYLKDGTYSPHFKRLQECKEAQETLQRNLGYVQDLNIYQPSAVPFFGGSDMLVNLAKLYYGPHQHDPECTIQILEIIRKNPRLRTVAFYGSPFYGPDGVSVERLAAALQPLTQLTNLEFKPWSDFNVADMKLLLDAFPKGALKSLRMKVNIRDDNLYRNVKALSSSTGDSNDPYVESATTPLMDLETLSIVMMSEHGQGDTTMLYRPLVFPILRRCPNLKCLSVSALETGDIAELSTIFQKTCPLIERLKFHSHHRNLDERACADLILNCPRVRRIKSWFSSAWDMTEFVPRIIRHQDSCLRIEELYLNTTHGTRTSEWMQRLFCSMPNLRVYKQSIDPDADRAAHLNICDMVRSRWVCTKLEKLYLALGSTSDWPEEEAETGAPETLEQRKRKIRQVYQQFGALKQLKELGIRYDIQKKSPVHFDITIKTGLKALRPCMSSLRFLEILEVEGCQIGRKELVWMENLGLTSGGILFTELHSESEEDDGSDREYVYEEDSEVDD
ncbi:hypothetical protein BG005_002158 [Podila minutissima]|nr:hypothetical protein BG005_002158 [Podila minutissima]